MQYRDGGTLWYSPSYAAIVACMRNTGSSDQARILINGLYGKIHREFQAGRIPVYSLCNPQFSPCYLAGTHALNGTYYSIELVYGSRDFSQNYTRVTTWRDVPGQNFYPEAMSAMAPENHATQNIQVDGATVPSVLRRDGSVWQADLSIGNVNVFIDGLGPEGDLSLETLADINPALEAGKAYLQKDFQ